MEYPTPVRHPHCASCRGEIKARYKEAHGLKFHYQCFICVFCKERLFHGYFVEKDENKRRMLICADCSTKRFMQKKASEQARIDAKKAAEREEQEKKRRAAMQDGGQDQAKEEETFNKFFGRKKGKQRAAVVPENRHKWDNFQYVPPSGPRKELPPTPGADVEYEYMTPEADIQGTTVERSYGGANRGPQFHASPVATRDSAPPPPPPGYEPAAVHSNTRSMSSRQPRKHVYYGDAPAQHAPADTVQTVTYGRGGRSIASTRGDMSVHSRGPTASQESSFPPPPSGPPVEMPQQQQGRYAQQQQGPHVPPQQGQYAQEVDLNYDPFADPDATTEPQVLRFS